MLIYKERCFCKLLFGQFWSDLSITFDQFFHFIGIFYVIKTIINSQIIELGWSTYFFKEKNSIVLTFCEVNNSYICNFQLIPSTS